MKKALRYTGGTLLIITILTVMWALASVPMYLIDPQSWTGVVQSCMAGIVILLLEVWILISVMGNFMKHDSQ